MICTERKPKKYFNIFKSLNHNYVNNYSFNSYFTYCSFLDIAIIIYLGGRQERVKRRLSRVRLSDYHKKE